MWPMPTNDAGLWIAHSAPSLIGVSECCLRRWVTRGDIDEGFPGSGP
jgi:hypothetical protein